MEIIDRIEQIISRFPAYQDAIRNIDGWFMACADGRAQIIDIPSEKLDELENQYATIQELINKNVIRAIRGANPDQAYLFPELLDNLNSSFTGALFIGIWSIETASEDFLWSIAKHRQPENRTLRSHLKFIREVYSVDEIARITKKAAFTLFDGEESRSLYSEFDGFTVELQRAMSFAIAHSSVFEGVNSAPRINARLRK